MLWLHGALDFEGKVSSGFGRLEALGPLNISRLAACNFSFNARRIALKRQITTKESLTGRLYFLHRPNTKLEAVG